MPRLEKVSVVHGAVVAALMEACLTRDSWSEESLRQTMASPDVHTFLLFLEGAEPMGFALLQVFPPEAEILSLGILPAFQNRGYGQAFLADLISILQSKRINRLFLEVAIDNIPARKTYARVGFQKTGYRPHYYKRLNAPSVDAVIMALDISESTPKENSFSENPS